MSPPGTVSADADLGLVCRQDRGSGFKLALVVGYPTNFSDKLRVRVWRAASACWTQPTLVERSTLAMLDDADHKKRGAMIARAAKAALWLKLVARVWS